MAEKQSKKDLFLELAKPNDKGISDWVNKSDFTGKYEVLKFSNGFDWGRGSSLLAQKYNIEIDRSITSGNSIDRIRLKGIKKASVTLTQSIRTDIRTQILTKRCIVLGTKRSCDHTTEVDHKDGRKNDPRVMNTSTQELSDFQPLSKPANDAKRQFCKECADTGQRYDAKNLGYTISITEGNLTYEDSLGCVGCFWYDPVAFRQKLTLL